MEFYELIETVGFPGFFCLLTFIFLNKETKNHREEIAELSNTLTGISESLAVIMEKLRKEV